VARQDRSDTPRDSELSGGEYISLLAAISQTMASKTMLESMQMRHAAIRGQIGVTRDEEILDALLNEEKALNETMRLTGVRVAKAVEFFQSTKLQVQGMTLPVTEVAALMQNLKKQSEQFSSFKEEVQIFHGNMQLLEGCAKDFLAATQQMAKVWALQWSAIVNTLESVRVRAMDVTQFEIGDFHGTVIMTAVWNLKRRAWEIDEGLLRDDVRLEAILVQLNKIMATRTAEDGTELTITLISDAKGNLQIKSNMTDVTRPNFRPVYVTYSTTSDFSDSTGTS